MPSIEELLTIQIEINKGHGSMVNPYNIEPSSAVITNGSVIIDEDGKITNMDGQTRVSEGLFSNNRKILTIEDYSYFLDHAEDLIRRTICMEYVNKNATSGKIAIPNIGVGGMQVVLRDIFYFPYLLIDNGPLVYLTTCWGFNVENQVIRRS